jgi:DNA anti-recombination protein RmuC
VVEVSLNGVKQIIETRLDGMDKAIELLQKVSDKFPSQVTDAVGQLQKVHEEKFHSIATQFTERDTRTEQTSRDSKVAVDAALQAAKEAVGAQTQSSDRAIAKSEAATTKQIDQIGTQIGTIQKSIDDKIDDIKARLQAIESLKKGSTDAWVVVLGIAMLLLTAVMALGAVGIFIVKH